MLPKEATNEFKKIYLKELGKKISNEQAQEKGVRLLELLRTMYDPIEIGLKRCNN